MSVYEVKENEFYASCLSGLEALLATELQTLGIKRVRPLMGGVAFFSTMRRALRVCLWSRLASRILLVVDRLPAANADELYVGVRNLAWDSILAPDMSFAVQVRGTNENLRNTQFTALKIKDALCDSLRVLCGKRPSVNTELPDAALHGQLRGDRLTLSLDLSAGSLYKRAYLGDEEGGEAPLECAVAAGVLALSGWKEPSHFQSVCVDPACGTGALIIEAASISCDLAPALLRERWGFYAWRGFEQHMWDELLDEADGRFECGLKRAVALRPQDRCHVGTSCSSPAIQRARIRVKRAGLREVISIEYADAQNVGNLVERACATAQRSAQLDACLIACVLSVLEHDSGATEQASLAAFLVALNAAPENAHGAQAGSVSLVERFDDAPCAQITLGAGRASIPVYVFDHKPSEPVVLQVPDAAGGAEHAVQVLETSSEQFLQRLKKVAKERRKWARNESISCYRVYDADLPDYTCAIEKYAGAGEAAGNDYVHISEYAPPHSIDQKKAQRRFDDVLALAPVVLGVRPDHVFVKRRQRNIGGAQYGHMSQRSYLTTVEEGGFSFQVDLSGYLDTGLFLDGRLTRQLLREKATGKRFLNLFAYTGTASVYAAGGAAVETLTVDLSQTYLDWARRNMAANGFEGPAHCFERADVTTWITACRRSPRRFDLIYVDPPTFSNSKAMGMRTWEVQRDHVELLIGVSRLLAVGGEAIFSCNLRNFKPQVDQLNNYGVSIQDISAQTIPHDFERNSKIHHCYLVKRR